MLPNEWLKLSPETRKELAVKFGLVPDEGIRVIGDQVVGDGYSAVELMKIPMGGYELRDTDQPITHFLQPDGRDVDPADTRNQNSAVEVPGIVNGADLVEVHTADEGGHTAISKKKANGSKKGSKTE